MKLCATVLLAIYAVGQAQGAVPGAAHVELSCHRTANKDVPENTLESLEQAALLGCDVVEVDVRKTLDGKLVLHHDGFLERLTDGIGEVEQSYFGELRLRDAGSWMGNRFQGLRIPLFEDALRLARNLNIRLYLDLKDAGIGAAVLDALRREGMLERVQFGGEWDDVKQLYPGANQSAQIWTEPGITAEQIRAHHQRGETVIVNFSANEHEMDLAAMKATVTAGADGINVDYPRLGADAVGRPVERRIAQLTQLVNTGESSARSQAILALSRYRGFDLQSDFAHWLLDSDDKVSRAAAIAIVASQPRHPLSILNEAFKSQNATARANAAWILSEIHVPASAFPTSVVIALLHDREPRVREEALLALTHVSRQVSARELLPMLSDPEPAVRGAAALALATQELRVAAQAIAQQIQSEMSEMSALYDAWVKRGKTPLTVAEKDKIVLYYRCQVKEVMALGAIAEEPAAQEALEKLAFRPGKDYSQMNSILAAFQLWDRIDSDPQPAMGALSAVDRSVADRAEWMLVHADRSILPEVREALNSPDLSARERAIRIVAWRGDAAALPMLRDMLDKKTADSKEIEWAIETIRLLNGAP